jgi:hypothetical protein
MDKRATIVNRFISIGIVVSLGLATFSILTKVRLYGDDWHYFQYATGGIKYFFLRHYDHYLLANGRALVHLWVTLFLALPMVFWRIINTFFVLSVVVRITDLSLNKDEEMSKTVLFGLLVVAMLASALDRSMTEQSVYWLTGSFNYLYPLWLFTWFMHRYIVKNKSEVDGRLMVLGFFTACTVEQVGMMTIGLVVLTLVYNAFFRSEASMRLTEKIRTINKKEWVLLMIVTFGAATVILAPSVFLRMTLEKNTADSTLDLVFANIFSEGGLFYKSDAMASVHVLAILAGCGVLYRRIISAAKLKKIEWLAMVFSAIGVLGLGLSFTSIQYFENINIITGLLEHKILLPMIIGCYLIFLIYTSILVFVFKWIRYYQLPLIILLLGIGSILMLLISPIFGYRNLLYMYFLLVLYGVLLLQIKISYNTLLVMCMGIAFVRQEYMLALISGIIFMGILVLRNWRSVDVLRKFSLICMVMLICTKLFLGNYAPYSANASSYDINLELAEEYKRGITMTPVGDPMPLQLIMLPYREYRWTMPYEDTYYNSYFNMYMGIDPDTKIEWIAK